ncbi:MAG: hypothetical protein IPI60_13470 [Saprospiraceae bacterium]|nr:hypothetical protein [Saprospiraceae bacterium]
MQDSLEDWENGQIRAAGVSAFGFGGTNAHVILEEYKPAGKKSEERILQKPRFKQQKFTFDIFPGLKPAFESLYSVKWNEADLKKSDSIKHPDFWLIYCSNEHLTLKEKITEEGIKCYSILSGTAYSRLNEDTFTINNSDENHLRWFFEGLDKSKSYGIVFIPDFEKEISSDKTITQLLHFKSLFNNSIRYLSEPIFWCITSNAFKIYPHEESSAFQHSVATAMGSAMNENVGLYGGIIDIEGDSISENTDLIAQNIYQIHNHPIVVRNKKFYFPSLFPVNISNGKQLKLKMEEYM